MRVRTVLFVLAALVVVVFALLNWGEIMRPTELNLGWRMAAAPLGLVLLGLLLLAGVAFMAASASTYTRHLMETRQQAKALQAQRDLADRAEASRFTDLRQQVEAHLRESRQREADHASELDQAVGRHLRELRNQLQDLQRGLGQRLGEMEARLSARDAAPAAPQVAAASASAPMPMPMPAPSTLPQAVAEPTERDRVHARQAYYRGEPVLEPAMGGGEREPAAAPERLPNDPGAGGRPLR